MDSQSIAARSPRVKRPGVYSITCTNGKIYVGSTGDLAQRFARHRSDLRNGKHANRLLQADHDRYGPDSFTIAVLEECALAQLDAQERHWMHRYNSDLTGYNIKPSYGHCRQGREDAATLAAAQAAPRNAWLKVFDPQA